MGRPRREKTNTTTLLVRSIPIECHTWLKVEAAQTGKTMGEVLTQIIRERIKKGE